MAISSPISSGPTRDGTKAAVVEAVEGAVRNYLGNDSQQLSAFVKEVLEERLRDILPQTFAVRIVEEDEDMQIVRHIHEEPNDIIQVEVTATLDTPMKYLVLHLNSGSVDERLGIEFVSADGSGHASGSSP